LANSGVTISTDTPFAGSSTSAHFAGSDEYLSITDASQTGLDFQTDFTIEWWMKMDSGSTYSAIFSKSATDGTGVACYYHGGNGCLYIRYFDASANVTQFRTLNALSTPTSWHHYAISLVLSSHTCVMYVDGGSVSLNADATDAHSINDNATAFEIGRMNAGALDCAGLIDEFRYWGDIRTGTEVNDNKGVELTGSESGL